MSFGSRLKEEREKRGWSQEELAKRIYVSRQSVSKWETGKNYPSIDIIIKLSDLFEITIDELIRRDEKLTNKIIEDGKKTNDWLSSTLFGFGILMGIIIVSFIKYGEVTIQNLASPISTTLFVFIFIAMISKGTKKIKSY